MEKKTAKLIELLELTELRMSVTETESTVFEKIIPTIDIESDKYKTKRDCLVEELLQQLTLLCRPFYTGWQQLPRLLSIE